jgi:DNA-binding NarL/FixJ family response regulator
MGRPKILLADDQPLILDALKELLTPEFEVVGAATDGRSLLVKALESKPDVILLEIKKPDLNGLEAGPEIKRLLPKVKLIVITICDDVELARTALHGWASGYLIKDSTSSELSRAIHAVLQGRSYVTPKVAQGLEQNFIRDPRQDRQRTLTPRQREVLQLLAEGRTMRETAVALQVKPRTIAFHKYRIMEDFGLRSNSDLVRFALRMKVIHPF